MLNTSVNTKRILLDERVEMKVAVDPLMESTIYCRPFEEDVHNVSAFTVNGQEFVHNYVTSSDNQKYIVTNIITEDGDVHEDVYFKVVVVEDGTLPMSVVNLRKVKETKNISMLNESVALNNTARQPAILAESVLVEKVREYKRDLLTEFLTFSQVQQKYVVESIDNLKKEIDKCVEQSIKNVARDSIDSIIIENTNIANEIEKKFITYTESLQKRAVEVRDEALQIVDEKVAQHDRTFIEGILPQLEKAAEELLREKIEPIEQHLVAVDEQIQDHEKYFLGRVKQRIQNETDRILREKVQSLEKLVSVDARIEKLVAENTDLKQSIAHLNNERQVLKTLVESAKTYTDAQVSRASRDAEYYARRILDLGGGGGSVATQFANGGVMHGDLTINGNILSGGNNLVNVFAGEGGGDDNPINAGEY